jgi:hypothetical protein
VDRVQETIDQFIAQGYPFGRSESCCDRAVITVFAKIANAELKYPPKELTPSQAANKVAHTIIGEPPYELNGSFAYHIQYWIV